MPTQIADSLIYQGSWGTEESRAIFDDVPRTHGQRGLPITFGFKVAVRAREIRRHIQRLQSLRQRLG